MSWNVKTNAEEYKIDTDGLSDKLNILINVSKIEYRICKFSHIGRWFIGCFS